MKKDALCVFVYDNNDDDDAMSDIPGFGETLQKCVSGSLLLYTRNNSFL